MDTSLRMAGGYTTAVKLFESILLSLKLQGEFVDKVQRFKSSLLQVRRPLGGLKTPSQELLSLRSIRTYLCDRPHP